MRGVTSLFYVGLLILVIVALQSHETLQQSRGRKKKGDAASHKHPAKPVVGPRSPPRHQIYSAGHKFSNSSGKQHKRIKSKTYRSILPESVLPIDGDPDSEIGDKSGRKVLRLSSGSVGYRRLTTPQWFRPIYRAEISNRKGQFFGSVIVLTNDSLLIDSWLINGSMLEQNKEYILHPYHLPDAEIKEKWINYTSDDNIEKPLHVIFNQTLPSGFHYFQARSHYAVLDKFAIKWKVNFNRHIMEREECPDDKYRRLDLGCFGFKYTKMKMGNEEVLVNTEYPVSVVEYWEDDRTTVFANDGLYSYGEYSSLRDYYNSGSPVFCGTEGRLSYFARQLNETTKVLIPIHDIVNDIRAVLGGFPKFAVMLDRRNKGDKDPNWSPNGEPPWWFRQVFTRSETNVRGSRSWYAGYMIVMSHNNFLIPDDAAAVSVSKPGNYPWTYFYTYESPTKVLNSFGSQFGVLDNNITDVWPILVKKINHTRMSLYVRFDEDPGWRKGGWPKIQMGKDYYESNCDYLAFKSVAVGGEPDVRMFIKIPAFVVPNSCSKYFCYIIFEGNLEPGVIENTNPVMCDGHPAFIMFPSGERPATGGRLALRFEYIMDEIKSVAPAEFYFTTNIFSDIEPPEPLFPPKQVKVPTSGPPDWFKIMLNSHPGRGPMFDYAGSLVILGPNHFIAADYVVNNALPPRETALFKPLTNSTHKPYPRWIYGTGRDPSPNMWSGKWDQRDSDEEEKLNEDGEYYPEVVKHLENVGMVLMNWKRGFGGINAPERQGFSKDVRGLSNCTLYTYTRSKTNPERLDFTEVILDIKKCNHAYCYGPVHPLSAAHDINQGVHAGAPVVCDNLLTFYNAPYPDHLNKAQFRLIWQEHVHNRIPVEKIDKYV